MALLTCCVSNGGRFSHNLVLGLGQQSKIYVKKLSFPSSNNHNYGKLIFNNQTRYFTKTKQSSSFHKFLIQHFSKSCQGLKTKLTFCTVNNLDVNRKIVHDVILYSNKNESFFKMLSLFGVFQMFIWGYLALFSVQDLRVIIPTDTSELPFWKKLLYKEGQYKNAISILSLFVGITVLFISASYPQRAIKSLWLLKGGKEVKVTTFSWLGHEKSFVKPVDHINCLQSRAGNGLYIPLQIKDKYFYFLVDKKGQFHNTDLFDFVVAMKRSFK